MDAVAPGLVENETIIQTIAKETNHFAVYNSGVVKQKKSAVLLAQLAAKSSS